MEPLCQPFWWDTGMHTHIRFVFLATGIDYCATTTLLQPNHINFRLAWQIGHCPFFPYRFGLEIKSILLQSFGNWLSTVLQFICIVWLENEWKGKNPRPNNIQHLRFCEILRSELFQFEVGMIWPTYLSKIQPLRLQDDTYSQKKNNSRSFSGWFFFFRRTLSHGRTLIINNFALLSRSTVAATDEKVEE